LQVALRLRDVQCALNHDKLYINHINLDNNCKTTDIQTRTFDASTVNAFKARLDKFWSHQAVKYDFTADLTGTRNQSEELLKSQSFY